MLSCLMDHYKPDPGWMRVQVRPPVVHNYGCGPLREVESPPTVRVFKHRLLQHFMLSLFCKLPVQPLTRIRDMRAAFMVSIAFNL